jgi:hypothetical protein
MDIDETQVFIFLKSVNRRVHSRKELMKYIDESKILRAAFYSIKD